MKEIIIIWLCTLSILTGVGVYYSSTQFEHIIDKLTSIEISQSDISLSIQNCLDKK